MPRWATSTACWSSRTRVWRTRATTCVTWSAATRPGTARRLRSGWRVKHSVMIVVNSAIVAYVSARKLVSLFVETSYFYFVLLRIHNSNVETELCCLGQTARNTHLSTLFFEYNQSNTICLQTLSVYKIQRNYLISSASPYFIIHLDDQHVDKGSQLTWRCEAMGYPQPHYTCVSLKRI